jgi:ligand-binding sensor domain-containing protein
MYHKTWTARDGAPQGVTTLALATDGVLWVGSEGGLFSFDGRTFTAFQSPSGQQDLPPGRVRSILATPNGAIWVGFLAGGVARISQGRVRLFTEAGGLRLANVRHIRQAPDGGLWDPTADELRPVRRRRSLAWGTHASRRSRRADT